MNAEQLEAHQRDFEKYWNATELPVLMEHCPRISATQIMVTKNMALERWLRES